MDGGWWMVVDGGWWMVVDGFQKGSLILLKILSDEVHGIEICCILENLRKTFSIGKKSDFKFQNRGYFPKKILLVY